MTTHANIAAELREIAQQVHAANDAYLDETEAADRLRKIADALEAQQAAIAAPTDLTEWQRELMRLVRCLERHDGYSIAGAIESHAAQMVQRVAATDAVGIRLEQRCMDLESRCEAAEKDAARRSRCYAAEFSRQCGYPHCICKIEAGDVLQPFAAAKEQR